MGNTSNNLFRKYQTFVTVPEFDSCTVNTYLNIIGMYDYEIYPHTTLVPTDTYKHASYFLVRR